MIHFEKNNGVGLMATISGIGTYDLFFILHLLDPSYNSMGNLHTVYIMVSDFTLKDEGLVCTSFGKYLF